MTIEYWDFDGVPVSVNRDTGEVTAWNYSGGRRIPRLPNPSSDTPLDKETFDKRVAQIADYLADNPGKNPDLLATAVKSAELMARWLKNPENPEHSLPRSGRAAEAQLPKDVDGKSASSDSKIK